LKFLHHGSKLFQEIQIESGTRVRTQ
jgi:hypothetical protein